MKWDSAAIVRCRNCDAHVSVGSWPYENSSARRSVKFRLLLQHFRFTPSRRLSNSGTSHNRRLVPVARYSITSSAVASSIDGISRPSSLAVFKLMTSSNLVGC